MDQFDAHYASGMAAKRLGQNQKAVDHLQAAFVLDVFAELGGAYPGDTAVNALFENPGFGNHWICCKLIGVQSNRCAIGARLHLVLDEHGQSRHIYRWVGSGGSFGANPLRQEIGLGQAEHIARLEVFWPTTGQTQVFENVEVDQFLEIQEGSSELRPLLDTP